MQLYKNKIECCGCGACSSACPTGALLMQRDAEGFAYPVCEENKCIHCENCREVCPLQGERSGNEVTEFFAVQAKEEKLREESSSGGVFPLLAAAVLDMGGVVAAAGMDEKLVVAHRIIARREDISQLTKTKYVQSDMGGIHAQISAQLEQGKPVLFCGTPCQTESVRKCCGAAEGLYLVDLVCYGVPSPGIWESYLGWLADKQGENVIDFSFRDKRNRDHGHTRSYRTDSGEQTAPLAQDTYCSLYFQDLILRPSCHSCRFCTPERSSDLTIGDFWGIEKVHPDMDDGMGTSLVLLHTEKGRKLWELIREKTYYRGCEREACLQPRLQTPTSPNKHRAAFMALYRLLPFDAVLRLSCRGGQVKKLWQKEGAQQGLRRFLAKGKRWIKRRLCREYNKWQEQRQRAQLHRNLRCRDFSIIANNCWSSFTYQKFGLKYRTPFVGIDMDSTDFVRLCSNWEWYLQQPLEFIPFDSASKYEKYKRLRPFPVAKLGDVELYFMHYHTRNEAEDKWYRRLKRLNRKRLIFKLSQRECGAEVVQQFMELPLPNKICFAYDEIQGTIHVPELRNLAGNEWPILEGRLNMEAWLNQLRGKAAKPGRGKK